MREVFGEGVAAKGAVRYIVQNDNTDVAVEDTPDNVSIIFLQPKDAAPRVLEILGKGLAAGVLDRIGIFQFVAREYLIATLAPEARPPTCRRARLVNLDGERDAATAGKAAFRVVLKYFHVKSPPSRTPCCPPVCT